MPTFEEFRADCRSLGQIREGSDERWYCKRFDCLCSERNCGRLRVQAWENGA